jgi:galactose mutarotase-like enzyme
MEKFCLPCYADNKVLWDKKCEGDGYALETVAGIADALESGRIQNGFDIGGTAEGQ